MSDDISSLDNVAIVCRNQTNRGRVQGLITCPPRTLSHPYQIFLQIVGHPGSGQGRSRRRQLSTLQGFPGGFHRYARLTGYTHLAQSAAIAFKPVSLFHILPGASQVLSALLLIVAGLGNRTGRATIDAFAASSIGEKQAISAVVRIRPGSRLNRYLGHYRSNPHGFAPCGDEPVAQTESS
jgi:hypothetical protein